jgi:HrpA-like RNA helicase
MSRSTPPEITRTDLTTPILQLKSLGIDDLMKFEWVTPPPAEAVLRALEGLVAAGMIGEDGRLTAVGEKVAECPVDVNIARMASALHPPLGDVCLNYIHLAFQFQGIQMRRGNIDHCCDDYCSSKYKTTLT